MVWIPTDEHPLDAGGTITALTGDVTASGTGSVAATIAADAVTNAKAANMAQSRIKGRAVGAGTGDPTDLTEAQATAVLNAFVGDSGSGGTKGLVPAPAAGDAAAGKFASADGTWAVPTGGTGASDTLTYLTEDDESADLPNSRQLLAGTNVTFDDTVANERTVNATGGGSGDLVLVETKTPSAVGTITFSSLGSYTHLEIRWTARSSAVAVTVNLAMQVNGDTGSNYDRQLLSAIATTVSGTESLGATSAVVATLPAASATAGCAGGGTLRLYDYRGTTFNKIWSADTAYTAGTASGTTAVRVWGGQWRSTAAITSITLVLSSGNYDTGSTFSLYGLN